MGWHRSHNGVGHKMRRKKKKRDRRKKGKKEKKGKKKGKRKKKGENKREREREREREIERKRKTASELGCSSKTASKFDPIMNERHLLYRNMHSTKGYYGLTKTKIPLTRNINDCNN